MNDQYDQRLFHIIAQVLFLAYNLPFRRSLFLGSIYSRLQVQKIWFTCSVACCGASFTDIAASEAKGGFPFSFFFFFLKHENMLPS